MTCCRGIIGRTISSAKSINASGFTPVSKPYLVLTAARISVGQLRSTVHPAATAAVLTQTIAWANLQRPFDPGLSAFTESVIEDAAVDLIVFGLIQGPQNP